MSKLYGILPVCIGLMIWLTGCTEERIVTVQIHDTLMIPYYDTIISDCPPPVDDGHGYRIPSTVSTNPKRSPDNRTIAFLVNGGNGTSVNFLDIETALVTTVKLKDVLPNYPNGGAYCGYVMWCPYDVNKLYIHCAEFRDQKYAQNGYVYNRETGRAEKITPTKYGLNGPGSLHMYWLPESVPGRDVMYVRSTTKDDSLYILQEDTFYELPIEHSYRITLAEAPITNHLYRREAITGTSEYSHSLNGVSLTIVEKHLRPTYAGFKPNESISWSPDGRYLTLCGKVFLPKEMPSTGSEFEEIWILDTKALLMDGYEYPTSWTRLNMQRAFCMYSFMGIGAEFMTDSTLVVSMHKDGDDFSPLWEITTTGKLLRQLTF